MKLQIKIQLHGSLMTLSASTDIASGDIASYPRYQPATVDSEFNNTAKIICFFNSLSGNLHTAAEILISRHRLTIPLEYGKIKLITKPKGRTIKWQDSVPNAARS